jgi:MFS family permease
MDAVLPRPIASRVAISTYFFVMGACFASWAARIPDVQESLGLGAAALGAVLIGMPVGSLLSLLPAGWLITKLGSRRVTLVATVAYALTLPLIGLTTAGWQLALVLFLFGVAGDVTNIGINTQAVGLEDQLGKPIMSSFHGLWSLGAVAGSLLGTVLVARGVPPLLHFTLVSGLLVLATLAAYAPLLPEDKKSEGQPLFAWPDRALMLLGFIAFCCMLSEGAMADWSSIYYKQTLPAGTGVASLGYTAFAVTMALGRLLGDWVTARLGVRRMLQGSGVLIALGLGLALLVPVPAVVLAGLMGVGFGVATVVPLVYSAAGRSETMAAGVALAAVSTVGYTGFLLGPPLIGFLAGGFGLRAALGVVVALGIGMALLARRVRG